MSESREPSADRVVRRLHRTLTPHLSTDAPQSGAGGRAAAALRGLVNGVLGLAGVRLVRSRLPVNLEFDARLLEGAARERWLDVVSESLAGFAERAALEGGAGAIRAHVEDYLRLAPGFRVKQVGGGMGFLNGLKLFVATRLVSPSAVVESGVWRGFTTEVFHHALAPDARILSFDINLDRVEYRSPKQSLFECDWCERIDGLGLAPEDCLAFFDDHVDQSRRVREAASRSIRTLLFDDDFEAWQLPSDGWPAVPTASMVVSEWCRSHEEVEWLREGVRHHASWSAAELEATAALVERHEFLPSLHDETGFQPGSRMSFVRLRADRS